MDQFWDSSWESLDSNRLAQYISNIEMTTDSIISELLSRKAVTVCDAGCGCGIYLLKLARHGFSVDGFDISTRAVAIADELLKSACLTAELKTASVLDSGYEDGTFDAVISRDVLDHMSFRDGEQALRELYRIAKPRGLLFVTLDYADEEYETEPHRLTSDGDFVFTAGKWEGMVFHPYTIEELSWILPDGSRQQIIETEDGLLLRLEKSVE